MRTTLTLDDDVVALTQRVRDASGRSLKATVNEALRLGLTGMLKPAEPTRRPYRTPSVDLGRCLVGSLDDVAEVLANAEDDRFS